MLVQITHTHEIKRNQNPKYSLLYQPELLSFLFSIRHQKSFLFLSLSFFSFSLHVLLDLFIKRRVVSMMSRTCSQCGNNGHNSRTCTENGGGGGGGSGGFGAGSGENAIMLFGVRVTEGSSFRKSASMTNLSQYDQLQDSSNAEAGYASDDVVHASGRSRERKRGIWI